MRFKVKCFQIEVDDTDKMYYNKYKFIILILKYLDIVFFLNIDIETDYTQYYFAAMSTCLFECL